VTLTYNPYPPTHPNQDENRSIRPLRQPDGKVSHPSSIASAPRGAQLPREESRRGFQDFVGPTQLSNFPPQPLQLGRLLARRPRPRARVDLGLPHPLTQRLADIPSLDATAQIASHSEACSLTCSNTNPTARSRNSREYLFPFPAMIHILTQRVSLHQTRGGSTCAADARVGTRPAESLEQLLAPGPSPVRYTAGSEKRTIFRVNVAEVVEAEMQGQVNFELGSE
jgi:hypothetical protein